MTKQKGTGVSQIVQLIVHYMLGSCTFISCRISWVYYQFLQCKYECRLRFLHQFFFQEEEAEDTDAEEKKGEEGEEGEGEEGEEGEKEEKGKNK